MSKKSWLHTVVELSKEFPDLIAVKNSSGNLFSYCEIESYSNKLANFIKRYKSRKLIAVCLSRTNIDIIPIFLACLKLQSAIHLVEPKLGIDVNLKRLSKIDVDLLITDEENSGIIQVW